MLSMESAGREIHLIEMEAKNINVQIGEYELKIEELLNSFYYKQL